MHQHLLAHILIVWEHNQIILFLEIDNPGNITINIQGLGVNGGTNDIDFICWGPFTNPNTMCNLTVEM